MRISRTCDAIPAKAITFGRLTRALVMVQQRIAEARDQSERLKRQLQQKRGRLEDTQRALPYR